MEMKAKEEKLRLALLQQRAEDSAEKQRLEEIKKKRQEVARSKDEQEKAKVKTEKPAEAESREDYGHISERTKSWNKLESHDKSGEPAGGPKEQQEQTQAQAIELAAAAVSSEYLVRVVEKMIEEIYEEQLDVEHKSSKVEMQRKLELGVDKVRLEGAEREEQANR